MREGVINIRKISKLSLIPLVLLSSGVFADSLTIRFLKPVPAQIGTSDWGINGTPVDCAATGGTAIWAYNGTVSPEFSTPIPSDSPNYGLNSGLNWTFSPQQYKVCLPVAGNAIHSFIVNNQNSSFSNGILTYNIQGFSLAITMGGLTGPDYSFNSNNQTYNFVKCVDFDSASVVCCFSTDGQCDSPPF